VKTTLTRRLAVFVLLVTFASLSASGVACARSGPQGASGTAKVGPPRGTAIVVGGGNVGPEIWSRFIELAGGPDAFIIDIPTAGGAATYGATTGTSQQIKDNGAKNVVVLHTRDKKVADSDSFVAIIRKASGIWFEGGRQNLLVDAYAGTRAEKEFHNILARGGVEAGSSAGASIQGSFLIRGASTGNTIMDAPGRNVGFAFLRGVGIDQHVLARERLPDLADSVMNKYPDTLFISEDEGTAWVVQGDNAEIIGRSKAFVYNGKDATDAGKPFLTLWPGDRYNLATRRVTHRAMSESAFTQAWVDSVFRAAVGTTQAAVVIAQGGKVYVNSSYNIPPQRRYQPTTTMPNFDVGGLAAPMFGMAANWLVEQKKMTLDDPIEDGGSITVRQYLSGTPLADGDKKLVALMARKAAVAPRQFLNQRITGPAGAGKTELDTTAFTYRSNVDEMYRLEMAHFLAGASPKTALGWNIDTFRGAARQSVYGTREGKRNAYVRFPDRRASIIILTGSDAVDARALAETLAAKLLSK
jgi:cyanophycinase